MNTNEIVMALKCCSCVENQSCKRCQYEYCSKECEDLCGNAADLIESLQAWLAETQRRELTAVEDLEHLLAFSGLEGCKLCKNSFCVWRNGAGGCEPKWRGPQEARKGEAE